MERDMTNFQALSLRKPCEIVGQLIRPRDPRAFKQNGNDLDFTLQCSSDLDPHEVIWIIKPTRSALITRIKPIRTDHGEQDLALGYGIVQMLDEVDPQRNGVHV